MPTAPHFDQIRSWLNEINREKQAAAKSGKAKLEPTGRGSTTHPIKDVDDEEHDAPTGARASENEKDIKEDEPAGNVDETADDAGKSQEDLNLNIGTHQSETGGDPSVEDNYQGRTKDPGTSHPCNMDLGPKYGAWLKGEASALSDIANDILADIAVGAGIKTASSKPTSPSSSGKPQPTPTVAAQAGYELAAYLGLSKEAADQTVENVVAGTIKRAQLGADRVGAYILSFMQESEKLQKIAADPTDGATGEGPPPMPPGGPDPSGGDPAALADAAGGAGGPPPDAGVMPPPPSGGGGGGDAGHDQALQELSMALMELGIDPAQLAQLSAGGAGGPPPEEGGGAPPPDMGGGGAPPPGSPAEVGAKIASAVRSFKRSGRFEVRPAKTAAERAQRNEMKKYVLEVLGATR